MTRSLWGQRCTLITPAFVIPSPAREKDHHNVHVVARPTLALLSPTDDRNWLSRESEIAAVGAVMLLVGLQFLHWIVETVSQHDQDWSDASHVRLSFPEPTLRRRRTLFFH
uniref:Uncharacterized protein n=1 Tax=Spongospora subterranea TaxID=70186 RepID=A0A0H5RGU5_9EUKA|eukprot:CRZ12951.1 hypothetical protein [Spongospora subterranea]